MQWFYADQGKSVGPLSEEEFQQQAASGKITPKTLVWNEGMANWVEYAKLSPPPPSSTTPPPIGFAPANPPAQEIPAGGKGETTNSDLMSQARAVLNGNWGIAIAAVVIASLVNGVGSSIPFIGIIITLAIGGPITLGTALFFLSLSRGQEPKIPMIFEGFQQFGRAFTAYILVFIFTLLWTMLLIIPGIIAGLSYSMTWFIMIDDPSISGPDAIDRSKAMMNGMKWKFFCMGWRFFGWALLSILTCFIGFFWLMPYMQTSYAKFYDDVKGRLSTV